MALTQVQAGMVGQLSPSNLDTQAQYYGFKNRIINGAMMIDQRNAGAAVTKNTAGWTYTVDRFACYGVLSSGVFTVQQQTSSAPTGFPKYLRATVTTADSSLSGGDLYLLGQFVEGYNTADFSWGTSDASTITVSFKVRSSLTGTFGGLIGNQNDNYQYPYTYTINSANTWETKTITIPGPTGGTWNTTNGVGLYIFWCLGVSPNYSGTAGAWTTSSVYGSNGVINVMATNGATLDITGVQLEKGSTATSFDYRPYGTELALCQRYCQVFRSTGGEYDYFASGAFYNSTQGRFFKPLLVTMRTAPTFSSTAFGSFRVDSVSYITLSSLSLEAADAESVRLGFTASSAGSNATGYGCFLASSTLSTEVLSFFAEL